MGKKKAKKMGFEPTAFSETSFETGTSLTAALIAQLTEN